MRKGNLHLHQPTCTRSKVEVRLEPTLAKDPPDSVSTCGRFDDRGRTGQTNLDGRIGEFNSYREDRRLRRTNE